PASGQRPQSWLAPASGQRPQSWLPPPPGQRPQSWLPPPPGRGLRPGLAPASGQRPQSWLPPPPGRRLQSWLPPPSGRGLPSNLPALEAALQAKLKALHEAGSFPGATLGFVLPDGKSWSVSVGLADVENRSALRRTGRRLAGSIGKTYVSAGMLQLVQSGRVNLDTKIDRWFGQDAWFARLPNATDITLRM